MANYITLPRMAELPCDPDQVKALAEKGKTKLEASKILGMGLTTFNTRLRESDRVKWAWNEGHRAYLNSQNKPVAKNIGKNAYEDREFETNEELRPDDLLIFLGVMFVSPRRASLAHASDFTLDFVVHSLERLDQHNLVTKRESLYFCDFYPTFKSRAREAWFTTLFILIAKNYISGRGN